jgi:hypothetical protein
MHEKDLDLCSLCSWLRRELGKHLALFYIEHCQPHTLEIVWQGDPMDIVVGGTGSFTVVARNAEGIIVPDSNITVSSDNTSVVTATVNMDGSNGVATGVADGSANLVATDGTITSPPLPVNVTADLVVATLEIVPGTTTFKKTAAKKK